MIYSKISDLCIFLEFNGDNLFLVQNLFRLSTEKVLNEYHNTFLEFYTGSSAKIILMNNIYRNSDVWFLSKSDNELSTH